MKICKKCLILLPFDFFHKRKVSNDGLRPICKQCRVIESTSYRARNLEKIKASSAMRYASNPESAKARSIAWYASNPAMAKLQRSRYYIKNIDEIKIYYAKWNKENPNNKRIHAHNRESRKRKAGGKLSKGLATRLFQLQKGTCPCCKQPLGDDYQLDHIMPIALGGENIDSNIQLLRKVCNNQKRAKHPVDFMQSRGFLL